MARAMEQMLEMTWPSAPLMLSATPCMSCTCTVAAVIALVVHYVALLLSWWWWWWRRAA